MNIANMMENDELELAKASNSAINEGILILISLDGKAGLEQRLTLLPKSFNRVQKLNTLARDYVNIGGIFAKAYDYRNFANKENIHYPIYPNRRNNVGCQY